MADSGMPPAQQTQQPTRRNGMPDVPMAEPTPTPTVPTSSQPSMPPMRPAAPEPMPAAPLVPDPMPSAPLPMVEPLPVAPAPMTEPLPMVEPVSAAPESDTPSSVAPNDLGETTLPAVAEQP
jgi:hypothetical protein